LNFKCQLCTYIYIWEREREREKNLLWSSLPVDHTYVFSFLCRFFSFVLWLWHICPKYMYFSTLLSYGIFPFYLMIRFSPQLLFWIFPSIFSVCWKQERQKLFKQHHRLTIVFYFFFITFTYLLSFYWSNLFFYWSKYFICLIIKYFTDILIIKLNEKFNYRAILFLTEHSISLSSVQIIYWAYINFT